jgi:hypothetical protein
MKTVEHGDPVAEMSVSEATRARLIVNCEQVVSRTRAQLRVLPDVYLHDEEARRRRVALAAKLRRAERRLLDLRQRRLL